MPKRGTPLLIFALLGCIAIAAGAVAVVRRFSAGAAAGISGRLQNVIIPVAIPTTLPAASQPAAPAVRSYMDVVRSSNPDFPATQPLGVPLGLSQAAHIVLSDPVYLSPWSPSRPREIWITRPDAPPTEAMLRDAARPDADRTVHVVRERVLFVHWVVSASGAAALVLVVPGGDGRAELVRAEGRQTLPSDRDYRWERAWSWGESAVVPTAAGVSVFTFSPRVNESHVELMPAPATARGHVGAEPQVLDDGTGLLAWIPWQPGETGSDGAARFVDGQWKLLGPDAGWPQKILHLVPLLDGSVLQLVVGDGGAVHLALATLGQVNLDQAKINRLVLSLSDPNEAVRKKAYQELTQYGPALWPLLEKMIDDQDPEGQVRIRQLLKEKVQPTLGGMSMRGNQNLLLVSRLSDGGAVFYAEAGVSVPDPDADPTLCVPAWLSIRPGAPVELLPTSLVSDLDPARSQLYAEGDDWVAASDSRGPRLFYGNGFTTLLRKDESKFSELVGRDWHGRWLLRKPGRGAGFTEKQPATLPAAGASATLIIDPTLPDATPRLPVWVFSTAASVGWDTGNWPVAKNVSAYALTEENWRLLDDHEKMFTKADDIPAPALAPPAAPASAPAAPASLPSTAPAATEPAGPILFTDRKGAQYSDGLTSLRVRARDGQETVWPLPPAANGTGPAWLIGTADGRLFLFNQPGRVLRIKPTPGASEPFKLEATFTHNIPTVENPTRIWLDPAERIDIAWGNRLAFLFPNGYIPPAILEKMPQGNPDEE